MGIEGIHLSLAIRVKKARDLGTMTPTGRTAGHIAVNDVAGMDSVWGGNGMLWGAPEDARGRYMSCGFSRHSLQAYSCERTSPMAFCRLIAEHAIIMPGACISLQVAWAVAYNQSSTRPATSPCVIFL